MDGTGSLSLASLTIPVEMLALVLFLRQIRPTYQF